MKKQSVIENSATVMINTLAQKKMAAGIKVYNLSAGEPKLGMHPLLLEAAVEAMQQGKILYPPVSGIGELKKSLSSWMNQAYGCSYRPEECVVVNGGKFGIYLLLQLLLSKGDEVLIGSPYWVSYPAITRLFDGTPIIVETEEHEGWKVTPEKLKKAYTPSAKVLFLNNASNPTGILYTRDELAAILKFAQEHNVLIISDEVYSGLIYDNQSFISCGAFPEYKNNVLVIQSCSKSFGMTGWRVGFVLGNEMIIQQLITLVGQSTSGVTTVSQWVAVAALQNDKMILAWIRDAMQKRRDKMIEALKDKLGLNVTPPASSLYLFISLRDLGVKEVSSAEFCTRLLEEANIASVPGSAFGKEGYIRFSFGAEEDDLVKGIEVLANYL